MSNARNLADLLSTDNGKIAGTNLDVSFENISDSGTEGTKVALGTTAQRGSTTGQFRFNSTTLLAEYYDGSNYKIIDSPPVISSLDVTEVDSNAGGNQTIVITGSLFSSGAIVSFIGSAGTDFNASTVTVDSATQLTIVAPKASFLNAQEPYGIKVLNVSGLSATLSGQINVDTSPTWSTASGTLATIKANATGTHTTVVAADVDGDTIVYTELGGTVLSGQNLTLDSATGTITGDPTDVVSSTTLSFNLRATANTKTSDRAFNIVVNPFMDGSTYVKAIPVSANANIIASVLTETNQSGGSITEGVYFVQTVGADSTTYTYPVVLRNISGSTWMCISKNYVPLAYKNGDGVNSNDHSLSYGLMNSSNVALSGLNSNLGAGGANSASSLGDKHFRVAARGFSGTWATELGVYAKDNSFYTRSHGTSLRQRLEEAQAYDDNNYDVNSNIFYSLSGGRYFIFKGYTTDGDIDTATLSVTNHTSTGHDALNSSAEYQGSTWYRDGSKTYPTHSSDGSLSSGDGQLSIWVR